MSRILLNEWERGRGCAWRKFQGDGRGVGVHRHVMEYRLTEDPSGRNADRGAKIEGISQDSPEEAENSSMGNEGA